jgi:EKC/KEOPS complex subunit CGI121/TPRKB
MDALTLFQILSRQHIFAAVFRAVHDYLNGRLRSHNVHSEIVFSLNPTNNVCSGCQPFTGLLMLTNLSDN